MMNETEYEAFQRYREAERAKADRQRERDEAAKRAKAEAYERERAEEDAWMQRNRPDEWKRQQREAEARRRANEERVKRQKAQAEWQAGWKSESVADVVKEIVEATADMNKFSARYFDCYDHPGHGLFHIWCRRLVDAYKREHGKDK